MSDSTFKLLLDENINGAIASGLRRRFPDLDLVRAQDTEIVSQDDDKLVAFAALEGRILLSHDFKTVPPAWAARIRAALPVCGLIMIRDRARVGAVLAELEVIIGAAEQAEYDGQITYLDA